jgi:hypothetical protein
MKKYILILALLLPLGIFAQFNIQTEINYLKLINKQANIPLLKDNFKNGEIAASHFILNKQSTKTAVFYTELSKSFTLANKNEKALYYALVQRILFPNDSLDKRIKADFIYNALALGLNSDKAFAYWNKTNKENIPSSRNAQRELVLKMAVQLCQKTLIPAIADLGKQLKQQNYNMPIWYKDWEFLTRIKTKEKHKKQILTFTNTLDTPIFTRLDAKMQRKVYAKAIRFYTKHNALPEARKLLNDYKDLKLPFLKKMAIPYKKLRIFIKKTL